MSGSNGRGGRLDPETVEWLEVARVLQLDVVAVGVDLAADFDPDFDPTALDDQEDPVGEFAVELARFQMGTERQVDALRRLFDLAPELSIEREQLRGLLTVSERLATAARDMGFMPEAAPAANDNPADCDNPTSQDETTEATH